MEHSGEVTGEKQKLHDVGRNSVIYKLNEEFESILCIYFELIHSVKSITTVVFSPIGNLLYRQVCQFNTLDVTAVEQEISLYSCNSPILVRLFWGHPVLQKMV